MSPHDYQTVVRAVSDLAEKAAEPDGFVSLEKLRLAVDAEIEFRPLLVEGVIARPKQTGSKWRVLIDSETHPYSSEKIIAESMLAPLPPRFRNTLAHELAHTFAFGLQGLKLSEEATVKELEADTESLSPLLLLPRSALERLCQAPLTLEKLCEFRNKHSVSSEVLIQRFEALHSMNDRSLLYSPRLQNIAVGIGEKKGSAYHFIKWPLFARFTDFMPAFIHQLKNKGVPSLAELFPDLDFIASGGNKLSSTAVLDAGTNQKPTGERLEVEIQIEDAPEKFLWMIRVVNAV